MVISRQNEKNNFSDFDFTGQLIQMIYFNYLNYFNWKNNKILLKLSNDFS